MLLVGSILVYLVQSGRLNFEKLMLFKDAPEILAMMIGVLVLVVVPMTTFRWWLLLRAIGVQVKPKQTFILTWIGNFFNTTLPGAVTGDVVKGYYVIKAQQEEGRTRAFMTLLIDRFVGLFGLIVMAFFSACFKPRTDFISGTLALSRLDDRRSFWWDSCFLHDCVVSVQRRPRSFYPPLPAATCKKNKSQSLFSLQELSAPKNHFVADTFAGHWNPHFNRTAFFPGSAIDGARRNGIGNTVFSDADWADHRCHSISAGRNRYRTCGL